MGSYLARVCTIQGCDLTGLSFTQGSHRYMLQSSLSLQALLYSRKFSCSQRQKSADIFQHNFYDNSVMCTLGSVPLLPVRILRKFDRWSRVDSILSSHEIASIFQNPDFQNLWFSKIPDNQKQSLLPSPVKHCNLSPDFSCLPIIRTNYLSFSGRYHSIKINNINNSQ